MTVDTYNPPNGNGNGGTVAHYQPQAPAVRPRTVVTLHEWAQSAQAAYEVSVKLVETSFVPEAFRGKAHEATAAILAGDELGLSPMASLRSFDIIQGTAAPRAITLRAIVQSRGHEIWVDESTASRAIVKGRRAGSSVVQQSEWNVDRARGLGLLNKHNWKAQAKAMLIARATAECCRLVAADAILGIPYAVEELWDDLPPGDEQVPAPAASRRTAQRRTQPKQAAPSTAPAPTPDADEPEGPPLPGEDDYDEDTQNARGEVTETSVLSRGPREGAQADQDRPPAQDPDGGTAADPGRPAPRQDDEPAKPTTAQNRKMHALFREAQIGGDQNREARLQATSYILGRDLQTSKDMTFDEANQLIDRLEEWSNAGELALNIAELLERDTPEASE